MAKEKNNMVREAIAAYEYLTATDEEEKERAYLRMKYELDYNSGLDNARRKGQKEGLEKGQKLRFRKSSQKDVNKWNGYKYNKRNNRYDGKRNRGDKEKA